MESGDDASWKTNSSYGGERHPAELSLPGLEYKSLPFSPSTKSMVCNL